MTENGPLDGLVVVDATWGMPGAVGTSLLADYGARVIKVERPADRSSGVAFPQHRAVWDRSKWSVALDPEQPDDAEQLREITRGADVFVESFGLGRAARYGLAYDQLAAAAPELIVCSVTAYGQRGPWCDRPGYDALVAARLGVMNDVDGPRDGPRFLGHPAIGYGTGFLIAIDVLAAVHARRVTGRGQFIDVSLLDGALVQTPMTWWWNERGLSFVARESGAVSGFGRSRIITDIFECSDGEYVMVHSGGEGGFKRAMDLLGFGDEIREISGCPEMSVPLDDRELQIARELAPKVFASRLRSEWIRLFHEADLAVMPVLRPGEVLSDEQVRHAGMTVEVDDVELGRIVQTRPPIIFERSPAPEPTRAPLLDEHREEAFHARSAWTTAETPLSMSRSVVSALDGIRVLDLSSFFATGYGAKLLSDLGADVIKIETPVGDQLRPFPDPFEACNRGKRSLAIDLRTSEGLAAVTDLVTQSDVLMHNLRPGKAERLGMGAERLRRVNPQLIYCYLPGFGSTGPRKDQKSFEPLLSGFTGVLHEAAGHGNPPVRRAFGSADYYNGLLGCAAVLMALEHRSRTGEAQYVESPHLHSSLFVVSQNIVRPDGTPIPADLELDENQLGWGPTYRLFRTADGWLCLAAIGNRAFTRLCQALDHRELADDDRFATDVDRRINRAELEPTLEAAFASLSTEAGLARLEAADVPSERALAHNAMPEFFFHDWAVELERVFEHEHPAHGRIREVGLVTHLGGTPGRNRGPSALLGQHSRDILMELGRTADEIDLMVKAGVCVESERPS